MTTTAAWALAATLAMVAPSVAQSFSSHRPYLGRVHEGASLTVTAQFFDSATPPVPQAPDQVDCWVWQKGVDPDVVPPLYACDTVLDPGVSAVQIQLSPLATRIAHPDSTSTERHQITVRGRKGTAYIPLHGEFDVISDPGLVVDPTTGVPGPVLPATPTPGS